MFLLAELRRLITREQQFLTAVKPVIDAVLRLQRLSADSLCKLRGVCLKKHVGTLQCSECALSLPSPTLRVSSPLASSDVFRC